MADGAQIFRAARLSRQPEQPVHDQGEAELVLAQRGKAVPEQGDNQEMALQQTLDVEARVFDVLGQVIAQHPGVMPHPGPSEFGGLML
jgi:hypothetical protein